MFCSDYHANAQFVFVVNGLQVARAGFKT